MQHVLDTLHNFGSFFAHSISDFSCSSIHLNFIVSDHGSSLFPDHPNPALRARMGAPHPGLAAGAGKQVPGQPPPLVRTIDKEWPDKPGLPRPGMRPTIGSSLPKFTISERQNLHFPIISEILKFI